MNEKIQNIIVEVVGQTTLIVIGLLIGYFIRCIFI